MMERGEVVFSPIAHTHPIALKGSLPTDWEYWKKVDEEFIKACSKLGVLILDGWEDSSICGQANHIHRGEYLE
jgi:hypothetical protein